MSKIDLGSVGDNCGDHYLPPLNLVYPGGNAVNTAFYARLTGITVSYAGVIGNDQIGRYIYEQLLEAEVDVSHVKMFPGETGITEIQIENGERIFATERLGVQEFFCEDQELLKFLASHRFVHLSGFTNWPTAPVSLREVTARIARAIAKEGIPISIDFSDQPLNNWAFQMASIIEIGFFSRSEASKKHVLDEIERIYNAGMNRVVVTRGEKGSLAFDGNILIDRNAPEIQVKDTLGAGDSFIGTFLGFYLQNNSIDKCLEKATAVSAQICQRVGAWGTPLSLSR